MSNETGLQAKAQIYEKLVTSLKQNVASLPLEAVVQLSKTAEDSIVLEQLRREELDVDYTDSLLSEATWRKVKTVVDEELSRRNKLEGGEIK